MIPGNQRQTKFKHVLTQSTESLVYVRVWKTIFLQISHKKKKRMSCNFLFFVSSFNVFHCLFLFINATLNYICTHLRRNVLNCWNSVCMCVWVFLFSSSNNAWGERNSESSFWVQNIYTMRILQRIIALSMQFVVFRTRAPFQWKV